MNLNFIEKNLNPTGKQKGDCVVRAIMYAEKMCWDDVFNLLYDEALKQKDMPNAKKVYEAVLEQLGWEKRPMPKTDDGKRYTIKKFADTWNGLILISIVKHLTVIDNGKLIDTWDCSHKSICRYWVRGLDKKTKS